MFTGEEIVELLGQMQTTHVVALPDSTLGQWEEAILREARPIDWCAFAGRGRSVGGRGGLTWGRPNPIVMIQCTGLFESGDSLRNALYDYQFPLFALIGYRSYLSQKSLPGDSALKYTEPILHAWELDYRLVDRPEKKPEIVEHYERCRAARRPGCVLIAEGRG